MAGPVAVVCGVGNNAGDGYVLAALLFEAGIPCRIFLLKEKFSADGRAFFERCQALGVPGKCGRRPGTDGVCLHCRLPVRHGLCRIGAGQGRGADRVRQPRGCGGLARDRGRYPQRAFGRHRIGRAGCAGRAHGFHRILKKGHVLNAPRTTAERYGTKISAFRCWAKQIGWRSAQTLPV